MQNKELVTYFNKIKKDFPIFKNNNNLIYADSAASTQKPEVVINTISNFYKTNYSNIHRGVSTLSQEATEMYEEVREKTAKLINAKSNEIVFTNNSTQSLNLFAAGIEEQINEGDEIIISIAEHHANIVPFQELAKKTRAIIKYIDLDKDYKIDIEKLKESITNKTKIISLTHISNVLGTINNIEEISKIKKNAILIIDTAQSIAHIKIDVQKLGVDFLFFSSHKMLGPTGVGVLYGKYELLDKLKPLNFGGGMITEVFENNSTYRETPYKFEAGTPNIEAVIGFGSAIDYINKIGFNKIQKYEEDLTKYFLEQIKEIKEIELFGSTNFKNRIAVFSFIIKGIHPHDIGAIFNNYNIAIRTGQHCTMPLHNKYKHSATSRISLYIYNTKKDIDKIIKVLKNIKQDYEKGIHLK